ncbi:MAG: hypothetical protein ACYTG0_20740 [Planctomycetota bacterium]|jgi:hypothetical protein
MTGWFVWDWGDPYDYAYTDDSYAYYGDDGYVYIDGEKSVTSGQYAEQAASLANSAPEVDDETTDWLPLGVFAVATQEGAEPVIFLQLAVSKEGVITGTYYNSTIGTTQPVSGMVDRETQRAAWTAGDYKNTVMETGVYNLTQDESTLLVHFGSGRTQQWHLIRQQEPESEQSGDASMPAASNGTTRSSETEQRP